MKLLLLSSLFFSLLWFFLLKPRLLPEADPIDTYKGVPLYSNGKDFKKSSGRHYHWSGYYYGQKWQCVEFIKRFLFLNKNHRMPEVMGHAIDFFDPTIPSGTINRNRGMIQYDNGGLDAPQADDLIIFKNPIPYGHVGIISETNENSLEIIQQNVGTFTRQRISLQKIEDRYFVGDPSTEAVAWLRVP